MSDQTGNTSTDLGAASSKQQARPASSTEISRTTWEIFALLLVVGLGVAAITSDAGVQGQIGKLVVGGPDSNRLLVAVIGSGAMCVVLWLIFHVKRSKRRISYYVLAWLVGQLIIVGLLQMLPSLPVLETVQAIELRNLDPLAQAALQWGAGWSLLMLTAVIFTGPRLTFGLSALAWLLAILAAAVVVGTLPEESLPPLVLLPIAATLATVVFIGGVFAPADEAAGAGTGVSGADPARAGTPGADPGSPGAPISDSSRTGRVLRGVWTSVALVLLLLFLAEFVAFVNLNRLVNADQTVAERSVDVLISRIDAADKRVLGTENALRAKLELATNLQLLEAAVADIADQVTTVQIALTNEQFAMTVSVPTTGGSPVGGTGADSGGPSLADLRLHGISASSPSERATLARLAKASVWLNEVSKSNANAQRLFATVKTIDPSNPSSSDQTTLQNLQRGLAPIRRDARAIQEILAGGEVPTAGVFMLVASIFAVLVLLPWTLFVLFLLQKRGSRAREVLLDLCLLDGHSPPDWDPDKRFDEIRAGSLLDRVLGEAFQRRLPRDRTTPTVGDIQNALVDQAFNEKEYLVGLTVLSVVVAAGWYSVFYPRGGLGLADTITQGGDAWQLWAYLLAGLTPITAGFAGAYFWCVYALVRRYLDADLYPAAFLQCSVQFFLAFVLSLLFSIALPPLTQVTGTTASLVADSASSVGAQVNRFAIGAASTAGTTTTAATASSESDASRTGIATSTSTPSSPPASAAAALGTAPPAGGAVIILVAFLGGVSISAGFNQLLLMVRVLLRVLRLRVSSPLVEQPRLTNLEGIDIWTEARLAEEGVDNIQALASAPLQRLVLRTHFTTERLVDWVDQALLYMHATSLPLRDSKSSTAAAASDAAAPAAVPPDKPESSPPSACEDQFTLLRALRAAGIRNATELLAAGGWLQQVATVELTNDDLDERLHTMQAAVYRSQPQQPKWLPATIFTMCQSVIESPKWVHIANFRRATRDLFSEDTKTWMVPKSPRPPKSV